MMDGLPVSPSRAAEVETEIEDNGGGFQDDAHLSQLSAEEIEEEFDPPNEASPSQVASHQTGDYIVPEKNKEVWKQFGCGTEAGRMLRKLYKGVGPKEAASKVTYPQLPSPSKRWEPPKTKPAAPKAVVQVPRSAIPRRDMDDPSQWPAPPVPCRRPAKEILAELEAEEARRRAEVPDLPKGRNQDREKYGLQERFRYCGAKMLPKGSMGYVEPGDLPPTGQGVEAASRREARKRLDENGFNAEQREIFEDLIIGVQDKQARIARIDEEGLDLKPSKAKTAKNKEALELRNAIERDLKDMQSLMTMGERQLQQIEA